jgi:hypothetical protein
MYSTDPALYKAIYAKLHGNIMTPLKYRIRLFNQAIRPKTKAPSARNFGLKRSDHVAEEPQSRSPKRAELDLLDELPGETSALGQGRQCLDAQPEVAQVQEQLAYNVRAAGAA